jgi:hypothetical protein
MWKFAHRPPRIGARMMLLPRYNRLMGPNHVERRRIIADRGKALSLSVSARHKKGTARYNNNGLNCAKLDLRKASQVAKNDLTKLLFNLRCANCRRVCGQRYDPHDVNSICSVFFHPRYGTAVAFLEREDLWLRSQRSGALGRRPKFVN